MRLRTARVRFTIARLMVAVGVIAILFGAGAILRRQAHFQRLARHHAAEARQLRSMQSQSPWIILSDGPPIHVPAQDQTFAAYHEEMAAKYERAARYPWLPVEPDPPVPK